MGKMIGTIVLALWAGMAAAEEVVIAALGDSLTQGYGLPVEDGFVPQLDSWLDAQGVEARVINAGVSGDTTAGGLARVDWTLTPDVDALIVTLGGNDLLRGLPPEASRANLDGIVSTAVSRGVDVLVIGMQAPGNYGPAYKAAFDAMYPEIAEAHGTLYLDSFFAGLGGPDADPAALRAFLQADGIHPNAEGVARIVEGVGPSVLSLIRRAE
ncbi:arylesterase [Tateyamaria sp. SN6-1]|uniref:arylesterase n=1 Tax=Tateyamaria sp. SN6-1 TaxID=3092148 RepID=UPI0039F60F8C